MITKNTTLRRLKRTRSKLALNKSVPRLTVYRSNRYIWAQIIDDKHGKTLVSATTKNQPKATKIEQSLNLGKVIADLAKAKKILYIRFDRGAYRYHGRIKAVADGARQGGLKF